MKVTFVSSADQSIYYLDVDGDDTIDNIKAVLEVQTAIPMAQQTLVFNNTSLSPTSTLNAAGVKDGDMVIVQVQRLGQATPTRAPAAQTPAQPAQRGGAPDWGSLFSQALASAVPIAQQARQSTAQGGVIGGASHAGTGDSMSIDMQKRMEEEIRMQNVLENMQNAMEYSPESFSSVYMLYINCSVNREPIKAFVDSGAQVTIMSQQLAEKCNLMRLLDTRFATMAVGVGTQKILGRIHLAPIEIGGSYFNCTFNVMEDFTMDLLFGLNMLKAHQCVIDLKENVLRIGTDGLAVPFLSESELPAHAKLTNLTGQSPLVRPGEAPPQPPVMTSGGQGHRLGTASTSPHPTPSALPPSTPAIAPPSTGPAASPTAPIQPTPVNETAVEQLMGLGFPREVCLEALAQAKGNADVAAAMLFGS